MRHFLERLGISTAIKEKGRRALSIKGAHALRHTFAYIAGVLQIPITTVQSILRHLTQEMTELYQRHSRREDKTKFMQKLPQFFKGIETTSSHHIEIIDISPDSIEHERNKLIHLAKTLPLSRIKKILKSIELK